MSRITNIDQKYIGSEPDWSKPNTTLINALSWYSNQCGPKESKKYTLDYIKKNKFDKDVIESISNVDEWRFKNLGFCCRILMNGGTLDDAQINWVKTRINELADVKETVVKSSEFDKPKETVTIQDRIYIQCNTFISDLEDFIDEFVKTKIKSDFKPYDWLLKNEIKAVHAKQIIDHFKPLQEELQLVISKKDSDLVEGYSNFKKVEIKNYLDLVESILDDCSKIIDNKKITKKPRKKKAVSLDKKVAKVQYKKEDTDFKLVSMNPVDIIGSKQLIVFNTKTKKLGIYISKDDSGFSIKGTTLENFDDLLSVSKTLRKPLEILPVISKAKKTELKKIMNGINSKDSPLNGRINSDTILIKVIK
jgi:hypothetical protein